LGRTRDFAVCFGAPGNGSLVDMPPPNSHLDLASRIEAKRSAWTVDELAALLEMSPKTLYKMAKSEKIPAIRIDGMIRFDPAHSADWLRARMTGMGFRQKQAA
jgi:excisionase family DNA binding protein